MIRRAQPDDYTAIARIRAQAIAGEYFHNTFIDEIENTDHLFYVLTAGTDILGYALLELTPPEASLIEIAVDQSFQRMGLATTLLNQVIDTSRAKNISTIFLEVRVSSIAAIGLYEKLGFRTISVRKAYYTNPIDDASVMKLALENSLSPIEDLTAS